jgi:hypothetical protein
VILEIKIKNMISSTLLGIAIILSLVNADFSGSWVLKKALRDGVPVMVPQGMIDLLIVKDSEEGRYYNIHIRATNIINGRMIVKREVSNTTSVVRFQGITSTRMEPGRTFAPIERFLTQRVSEMTRVTEKISGRLIWEGPNVTAIFIPDTGEV